MKTSENFLHAAQHVLDEYLSKPYDDTKTYPLGAGRTMTVKPFADGGRDEVPHGWGSSRTHIDRPIHGLAHTMRTTAYAPILLKLFKKVEPERFRDIDEKELEKIMIAQLFFVAGRGSEASYPPMYRAYHEAGAQAFEVYARAHLVPHVFSEEDIVKYRGIIADVEPKYKKMPEASIVGWAHGIDLMRTRLDAQFFKEKEAGEAYEGPGLSLIKKFGKEDAQMIMEYAWKLFEAQGDSCQPYRVSPNGEGTIGTKWSENVPTFIRAPLLVQPKFIDAQYSVEACIKQIQSVGDPMASPKSSKPSAASPKKTLRQLDAEGLRKLKALQAQKDDLAAMLKVIQEMQAQGGGFKAQMMELEKQIQDLNVEIEALEGAGKIVTNEIHHFGARNYELKAQNVQCLDDETRDLVKIPGDGNCCFNAVLTGAYAAGANIPGHIQNHMDLRQAVVTRMREKHQQHMALIALGDGSEGTQKHLDYMDAIWWRDVGYPDIIRDYNRRFGKSIRTFDEYVDQMARLDAWGGSYELGIMAEILDIKILNHSVESDRPISIHDTGAPSIHIKHSGNHYDLFVASGTWNNLSADHPIIQFEQRINTVRLEQIRAAQARKPKTQIPNFHQDKQRRPPKTHQKVDVSYETYFKYSQQVNQLGIIIKQLNMQIQRLGESSEKEALRDQLKERLKTHQIASSELESIRIFLTSTAGAEDAMMLRYTDLMHQYDENIKVIEESNFLIRNLVEKKIRMIREKVPSEDRTYQALEREIAQARETQQLAKQNAQANIKGIGAEAEFLIRELLELNAISHKEQTHMIAAYKGKKVLAKQKLAEEEAKGSQFSLEDKTALTHLKQFLQDNYDETLTIKENIIRYFNQPDIRFMLHQGGPLGGDKNLGHVDARWIYRPGDDGRYDTDKGIYDAELIDHYSEQLARMIETEQSNPDSFVLYNAMTATYGTGNDVIRELSAIFHDKEYHALFRLFSDDFEFENAEAFRHDVYEAKRVMDAGPEFHKRGLCCSLSPFQPMGEEGALDFWAHDRNVQSGFDRWNHEIFPKISAIVDDPAIIEKLEAQYRELVEMSEQMGARMSQFVMSKEDMDQYTWLSGAYGFKLPAVTERDGRVVPTDNLSEALAYYQANPAAFITQAGQARKQYLADPTRQGDFIDHQGINQKGKAYDTSHDNPKRERENLGQFQARLYLHPDLFEPNRIQVNTYYALPPEPKLQMEYNRKVKEFAQEICGLLVEYQRKKKFEHGDVAADLTQTIILRPFTYKDPRKFDEAMRLLEEMVALDKPDLVAFKPSKLYQDFAKCLTEVGHHDINIEALMLKTADTPITKKTLITQLFYECIVSGNAQGLDALLRYVNSAHYDAAQYPIDLDKLTIGSDPEESALLLAAKYQQSEILEHLISFRESNIGYLSTQYGHPKLTRSAIDKRTLNTPLHYLAEQGDLNGFRVIANSLTAKRSWSSFYSTIATHCNKDGNTPLHILAMNTPGKNNERIQILKYLIDDLSNQGFNILFGVEAITQENHQGVSPLMLAAITQNFTAIDLLAEKAHLSPNQKQVFLWVAQNPHEHIQYIQDHAAEYGHIPGFVGRSWHCPEVFVGLAPKDAIEIPKLGDRPYTIAELSTLLENAIDTPDNKNEIELYYTQLEAAGAKSQADALVNQLVLSHATDGHVHPLDNLNKLIQAHRIMISSPPTEEDSLLIATIKKGEMPAVVALLKQKDNFAVRRTLRDSSGKTALHYLAERKDSLEAIIELLKHRSYTQMVTSYYDPIRIVDNHNNNPFHILAMHGQTDILKGVNEAFKTSSWFGANEGLYNQLNAAAFDQNDEGLTPIMVAAIYHPDKTELIKMCAKAMALQPAEYRKYEELANAIQANNSVQIQQALSHLEADRGTIGWNVAAKIDQDKIQGHQEKKRAFMRM